MAGAVPPSRRRRRQRGRARDQARGWFGAASRARGRCTEAGRSSARLGLGREKATRGRRHTGAATMAGVRRGEATGYGEASEGHGKIGEEEEELTEGRR